MCTRCIMDTSDPDIEFDAQGICSHCRIYDAAMAGEPSDAKLREAELNRRLEAIRHDGKGKRWDCVVGVSGGVDSTYVVLLAKQLGLRPLAVHLDNGWDSEIAVGNIQRALDTLGVELVTIVLDWEEFRDLQVAFLRASTPDSEIPSDHAIFSVVLHTAWKKGIAHLVLGHNKATELILPPAWSQGAFDWRYIRSVHRRFGTRPLKSFPHLDFGHYVRYRLWGGRQIFNILNYIDYSREAAITKIQHELGWRDYGGKHHESVYTRFFQSHILPRKFGFDKRRAHLSNRVLAGQISREKALAEIAKPPYASPELEADDRIYVIKKLGLSEAEFDAIMHAPRRRYADYPNMMNSRFYLTVRDIYRSTRSISQRLRNSVT
ncbi:MAG TPA: N-acetyl sugar amidotransferase [Polyangiaceae bacterium]|nr:N-acetyl sugar amidotransferase [Polyangiaceae bacterium]